MASSLNPLVIPNHISAHSHSRSPSVSSSASSNHALYDLYSSASAYPLGRPPHMHSRNLSNSSAAFSFATHMTSPADSPPQPDATHPQQQSFKTLSTHLSRTSTRRPRAGSSPYSRHAGDDHHSVSGSSRASSSSDVEQDDYSIFYPPQHSIPSHPHSQDYSGLFVAPHHAFGTMNIPPPQIAFAQDQSSTVGGFSLSPEQTLEQLAANVRSSTTTTASDRAKQIFVQAWLGANYAPYPDGNVPRQGLYNSYRRVCDQYNIPHINTATLGKAIRLCFPAIKTRRLGVRGNSKYHYCGIRPATVAEAEFLQDFVRRTTNHAAIAASSRRGAASVAAQGNNTGSDDEGDEDDSEASSGVDAHSITTATEPQFTFNQPPNGPSPISLGGLPHPLTLGGGMKSPVLFQFGDDKTPTTNRALSSVQEQAGATLGLKPSAGSGLSYGTSQAQIRNRRGPTPTESSMARPGTAGSVGSTSGSNAGAFAAQSPVRAPAVVAPTPAPTSSVRQLRNFPSIDEALGIDTKEPSASSSLAPHHRAAIEVWKWFEDHLDGLMESVRTWRYDQFEIHLRTFWASLSGEHREIVHAPAVAGLMVKADAVVYNEILEILRNQITSPVPAHALTGLRQLAEKMENILLLALDQYGGTFVEPKVELGARFGHLVLRFLDIFQVTQALSSVLSNKTQLMDMRRSWSEIDFESVRNQCALVCNCRHDYLVQLLEVDFVNLLDSLLSNLNVANGPVGMPQPIEPVREIMTWADACCDRLMTGNVAGPSGSGGAEDGGTTMSSRSVLIRWGYVTSQIMRDLTIRSDPAFGAFQILKLFLDDWIALNILRGVALSTNSVQASVEPAIPQQYLALSPMPGQEFTGSLDNKHVPTSLHSQLMDHTPTASSMLASLNDPYPLHHHHQHQPHHSSGLAAHSFNANQYPSLGLGYGSNDDHLQSSSHPPGSSHGHHHGGPGGDLSSLSMGGYADFGSAGQGAFDITSFLTSASSAAAASNGHGVDVEDLSNSPPTLAGMVDLHQNPNALSGDNDGMKKKNGKGSDGIPIDVKEEAM